MDMGLKSNSVGIYLSVLQGVLQAHDVAVHEVYGEDAVRGNLIP